MADPARRPLSVNRLRFPASALKDLSEEQRSSLLLLGLIVNETNWLYKLLVRAVQGLPKVPAAHPDNPEEEAGWALTLALTTTLVGKVHEGWRSINKSRLRATLAQLPLSDDLKALKRQVGRGLSGKLFSDIRNKMGFHYDEEMFDLSNLLDHLDDRDTHIYATPQGYRGDLLSPLSTLAIANFLTGLAEPPASSEPGAAAEPLAAYRRTLDEVIEVAGFFCQFASDAYSALIAGHVPGLMVKALSIPDAPESSDARVFFFVHPPENLEG
jgi:hypothetical protein